MSMTTTRNLPASRPFRVDKNMAFNIKEFRKFGSDAKLLKSIVLFMAVNHQQEDLFGFYRLEPKRFAEIMHLQEPHLFRMHPEPYFIKNDENAKALLENEGKHGRMSQHRTWSTELENALYILTHKTIIEDYRHKTDDKTVISSQRFNFLDEIRFELHTTGKTQKVVYYYKPNTIFENNLKNYFLISKVKKYLLLKKPKLDEAYLDLSNRITSANENGLTAITFNINTFADILQVQEYSQFSKFKGKISEKFEKLRGVIGKDIPGLQLTWASSDNDLNDYASKVSGRKPRKVENLAIVSWDAPSKKEKKDRETAIYRNIFDTELNRSLIQAFFTINETRMANFDEEDKKAAFYKWMFSSENMDIKEIKFQDTYVDVYKNTMSLVKHKEDFRKTLAKMANWQEQHKCFYYKDDQIHFVTNKEESTGASFNHFYELYNHVAAKG